MKPTLDQLSIGQRISVDGRAADIVAKVRGVSNGGELTVAEEWNWATSGAPDPPKKERSFKSWEEIPHYDSVMVKLVTPIQREGHPRYFYKLVTLGKVLI